MFVYYNILVLFSVQHTEKAIYNKNNYKIN